MKLFFTALIALSSLSAFAWFDNEVECRGKIDNKEIFLEIELPFPAGSAFRNAVVSVTEDGKTDYIRSTVQLRRPTSFTTVRYWSGSLDLEVDIWPDRAPRWGRDYRGMARISSLGNQYIRGLTCEFPYAN